MGLRITGPDRGPIPRRCRLVLTCDGNHGLMSPPTRTWQSDETGYIGAHSAAIAEGWSETSERVLCPDCMRGKKVKVEDDE